MPLCWWDIHSLHCQRESTNILRLSKKWKEIGWHWLWSKERRCFSSKFSSFFFFFLTFFKNQSTFGSTRFSLAIIYLCRFHFWQTRHFPQNPLRFWIGPFWLLVSRRQSSHLSHWHVRSLWPRPLSPLPNELEKSAKCSFELLLFLTFTFQIGRLIYKKWKSRQSRVMRSQTILFLIAICVRLLVWSKSSLNEIISFSDRDLHNNRRRKEKENDLFIRQFVTWRWPQGAEVAGEIHFVTASPLPRQWNNSPLSLCFRV